MKSLGKLAAKVYLWLAVFWLAGACAGAQTPTGGTTPAGSSGTPNAAASPVAPIEIPLGTVRGVLNLDGPWRFHVGDDPRWADPSFDDSAWDSVKLGTSLTDQGIDSYTGYGWYRLRVRSAASAQSTSPAFSLLMVPHSVGQLEVFVNGGDAGQTRGMADPPTLYQSPPVMTEVSHPSSDGSVVIAIRTWSSLPTAHGVLEAVKAGDAAGIQENERMGRAALWDRGPLANFLDGFLFLCVAALAATLYLAQRNHPEYLWLALLCVSVAVRGSIQAAFGLEAISYNALEFLSPWCICAFIVITMEFVLSFTQNRHRKLVRAFQLASLLLPVTANLHLDTSYKYLALSAQFLYCGLIIVLLFKAWRRGRADAGVMLIPFFLAAVADSSDIFLDFAANRNWIPAQYANLGFHLGSVEFGANVATDFVFLGSLVSVILYRFIRVSQEEQRSAAEIEAARSVQSMLIPTQLPSNRHFMLEGAYLPANGVGGDFFQVLPLKDDSLLIVVGDVSGKGLRAAMNASTLVGALRNELSHEPATVLNHLNQVMLGATSGLGANGVAGFATCLCARIHTDGRMVIANAGHLNPYIDGRELLLAPDLPLGVVASKVYEQDTFRLKPGVRIIFLSDGVVEARNAQGELFGFERTQQVSNESARYISQTAQHFGQDDDITVVSLYFASSTQYKTEEELVPA